MTRLKLDNSFDSNDLFNNNKKRWTRTNTHLLFAAVLSYREIFKFLFSLQQWNKGDIFLIQLIFSHPNIRTLMPVFFFFLKVTLLNPHTTSNPSTVSYLHWKEKIHSKHALQSVALYLNNAPDYNSQSTDSATASSYEMYYFSCESFCWNYKLCITSERPGPKFPNPESQTSLRHLIYLTALGQVFFPPLFQPHVENTLRVMVLLSGSWSLSKLARVSASENEAWMKSDTIKELISPCHVFVGNTINTAPGIIATIRAAIELTIKFRWNNTTTALCLGSAWLTVMIGVFRAHTFCSRAAKYCKNIFVAFVGRTFLCVNTMSPAKKESQASVLHFH